MGTISDKLTYLNETKSQIKSMINYGLETPLTNEPFRDYVSSIFKAFIESLNNPDTLWGNLPKITGTGTNISLNNTIEAPMKIELSPVELSQDATPTPSSPQAVHTISGDNTIYVCNKNLAWNGWAENFVARINTTTTAIETYDNRNCLKFSPAAGYGDYDNKYMLKIKGGFKENTRYSFKYDYYAISEWGNMNITYTDGTTQEIRAMTSNTWNNVFVTSQANKTIKYLRVQWRDNQGVYLDLDTFMVYEGTENTTYVANDGTDYSIDLSSKNLFDNYKTKVENNATLVITPTGFNITRTHNAGFGDEFIASYTLENLKANTTYTLNFNVETENTYNNGSIYVYSDNLFGTALTKSNYVNSGNNYKWNITTSSNGKMVIGFYAGTSSQNKIFKITNIMLELGSTPSEYIPYYEPLEYCKKGNYEDRIFKNVSGDTDYSSEREDGAWYIKKNIVKVVLDGNSNVSKYDNEGRYYINGIVGKKGSSGSPNAMSNYFYGTWSTSNGSIFISGVDGTINMINTSYLNDLAGFKTWLGTTNPIIYYILDTPTYTKIEGTLAEQLEAVKYSKDGQTNISQINNDLAFGLSATLIEDLT